MKVSSRETLMPTQSAQALDTEPGRTCPVGLSACLIYGTRGAVFPQVLLRRPLACTTHKLPESRFVRESKKKCPDRRRNPERSEGPIRWIAGAGLDRSDV